MFKWGSLGTMSSLRYDGQAPSAFFLHLFETGCALFLLFYIGEKGQFLKVVDVGGKDIS